ncbi:hypothetical protein PG984_000409 [Apiospora sp. TS-2023a]
MSVPPQTIRVKRKATGDEEPVSYLRLQDTKRHRSESYVYQRQRQEPVFAEIPAALQKPVIHSSKPTNDAAFQTAEPNNKRKNGQDENLPAVGDSSSTEPRRFHMSKREMMLAASQYPTSRNNGGSRKRPAPPALFVERRIKRLPSKSIASTIQQPINQIPNQAPVDVDVDMDTDEAEQQPEPRKFKKPGLNRLAQKTGNQKKVESVTTKPELPPSMLDRRNVEFDKFTDDMNAWTMQQIGLNLQQAEKEKEQEKAATAKRSQQLKYKPKVPAKRYTERHPEPVKEEAMPDAKPEFSDTDDDGDYIIETYIRVPLSAMEKQNVAPGSIGLLVFDDEPDSELFYGEGSDSENEWAEDDEDENAENYYTADYPDDEVASDDEFGLNPYSFRNNASDVEEYDLDDDESEKDGFKAFRGPDGLLSKHL